MDKKIIFQKCNINNIYFLFHLIAAFLNLFLESMIDLPGSDNDEKLSYIKPLRILIDLYISTLSDFIAIIPYFIMKRLVRKKEGNISSIKIEDANNRISSIDTNLIYTNLEESISRRRYFILFCFFIGILDFLEKFSLVLKTIINDDPGFDVYTFSCVVPFEIIFQFVCSYFILKIHFYKLQYFSLFLNVGVFFIILIIDLVNILKFKAFDGKVYFFYLFNTICYSVEFSLAKKIFLYAFMSFYLLIIIIGFIKLILVLIFSFIYYSIEKGKVFNDILILLKNPSNVGLFIGKIFSHFFITLFGFIIIDRFSPNYLPFGLIVNEFCYFIVDIIEMSETTKDRIKKWDLYFRLFLYLISTISVIIHNEIVVINVCNLGSDTKYFLDIEFKQEELYSKTDNPDILKRYETFIEMELEEGKEVD